MGHYGKHIIDHETGLCEICDKDAIRDIRHGKAPPKQVYYSNHDNGLTHRSNHVKSPYVEDRYGNELDDDRTPRRVQRIVRPPPAVRPRRIIYDDPIDQPVIVRRKIIRRRRPPTPEEDVIVHHASPRSKPYYYVDQDGQMVPQDYSPPPEPPRRYIVQSRNPPPGRTVRITRRRALTPSPPISEIRRSGPKRQINSDTEIIDRTQRIRREDTFHSSTTQINPEMYHIIAEHANNRSSPVDSASSPIPLSERDNTPPPIVIRDNDVEHRRQPRTEFPTRRNLNEPPPRRTFNEPPPRRNLNEPIQRRRNVEPSSRINPAEPELNGPKRVYKRPPPGKDMPPNDYHNSNENLPRIVRNDKNHLPPRRYASTPQLTDSDERNFDSKKNPSVYHIRAVD